MASSLLQRVKKLQFKVINQQLLQMLTAQLNRLHLLKRTLKIKHQPLTIKIQQKIPHKVNKLHRLMEPLITKETKEHLMV
jgi:ABC-type phosphate transport system auxiliary subunit